MHFSSSNRVGGVENDRIEAASYSGESTGKPGDEGEMVMDFANTLVTAYRSRRARKTRIPARCWTLGRRLSDEVTKKARPARGAGRAGKLNYLEDCTGAGAGAGALGQHEAASTEAAAAMIRNLTVFMVVVWLLVSVRIHE